MIERF
jgi:20S proteasome subunit beta 3